MFKPFFNRARVPLYPFYFANESLTKDIGDIFGHRIGKVISEHTNSTLQMFGPEDETNGIGKYLLDRIVEDKGFYRLVEKNVLKTGKELLAFCNKIPKDVRAISDEKLVKTYEEYAQKTRKMRSWGWVPPLVDGSFIYFLSDYLQLKLREHLASQGKGDEAPAAYSILSSAESMSEVQQEEVTRLTLLRLMLARDKKAAAIIANSAPEQAVIELKKSHPAALRQIAKHAKKYAWLTYAYAGPCMNELDVVKMMRESLKQPASVADQLTRIRTHYRTIKKQKAALQTRLRLTPEIMYLAQASAFFMILKDMRKGIYQKSYVLMDPVVDEIARRSGITAAQARYLTTSEIRAAIVDHRDFRAIADERTRYCVAVAENGATTIYVGEKARDIIRKEISIAKVDATVKELRGSTAFSGKATGIARIILVKEDMPKLKDGDILISSATNPELISAMKRAAAFVTDTGGITCHAAIVSREMKKPCIIGTKIATQVIKDGDKVIVDADAGIVHILR